MINSKTSDNISKINKLKTLIHHKKCLKKFNYRVIDVYGIFIYALWGNYFQLVLYLWIDGVGY